MMFVSLQMDAAELIKRRQCLMLFRQSGVGGGMRLSNGVIW